MAILIAKLAIVTIVNATFNELAVKSTNYPKAICKG
jgi:hypothetical protein